MAFYKDFEKKTRQEKREAAISRGGYDDEGVGYKKTSRSYDRDDKRPYGRRNDDSARRFGNDRDENRDPKKRYLNGKNG